MTLKYLSKDRIFEACQFWKTVKGEGESQPKCQIQNGKGKG